MKLLSLLGFSLFLTVFAAPCTPTDGNASACTPPHPPPLPPSGPPRPPPAPSHSAPAPPPAPSGPPKPPTKGFPDHFEWESLGVLVTPQPSRTNVTSVKDPSIVFYKGAWHVFASTVVFSGPGTGDYNMVYFTFKDFADAGKAEFHYLDLTPIGPGYRAAPQVFYFAPQKLWYLVYQDDNAGYSTNPDITNPAGWTAPKHFYKEMPQIVKDHIGTGYWLDFWVICDDENCHLFSHDVRGQLYRSQTPVSKFPEGMNEPVIAMQDANMWNFLEASNVYEYAPKKYGRRYFRSWTSTDIAGPWSPLSDTEENPLARFNNVKFKEGKAWTQDISHGEMIRKGIDQKLQIDPCNLRYIYQGIDPAINKSQVEYNSLPWRLSLLTQTNSKC
ncbi:glycosyl hydrolase family 62 protein [Coprinopsis sp. MPI-PUGE-AT-0042]|nr:glycosyl hydrolase family 62 protein [Coprinopsis sp. MPI-PUGE-AT-0042]